MSKNPVNIWKPEDPITEGMFKCRICRKVRLEELRSEARPHICKLCKGE